MALMVALSVAEMAMSPPRRVRTLWPLAALLAIYADTALSISLRAIDTPTETANPAAPTPMPTEAVPVMASMMEVSDALMLMLSASTPLVPRPSLSGSVPLIQALVLAATRLTELAPAPDRPMPAKPPAEAATEPATTRASMPSVESALSDRLRVALALVWSK